MFRKKTIRDRVMAVVEKKIAQAQASFDNTCKELDAKLKVDVASLTKQVENDKESAAEKLVSGIVGKCL